MRSKMVSVLVIFVLGIVLAVPLSAGTFRIATWNTQVMADDPNTAADEFDALVRVANRIGANVLCLLEVMGSDDLVALENFQSVLSQNFDLTYTSMVHSSVSTGNLNPFGLRTACLSMYPVLESQSWSAALISGDANANDITRDMFEVHISFEGLRIGLFIVHLKSATTYSDRFRRAIEIIRLRQLLTQFHNLYPSSPSIVVGDFNEDIVSGAPFGDVFYSTPAGLPTSWRLGNDITFPVIYDPFLDLARSRMAYLDISHEDAPSDMNTWVRINEYPAQPTYKRLDYIFYRFLSLTPLEGIVYDACDDDGTDAPPTGNFLPLRDAALVITCNQSFQTSISTTASDHFPVVTEFSTDVAPVPSLSTAAQGVLFALLTLVLINYVGVKRSSRHRHRHDDSGGSSGY